MPLQYSLTALLGNKILRLMG